MSAPPVNDSNDSMSPQTDFMSAPPPQQAQIIHRGMYGDQSESESDSCHPHFRRRILAQLTYLHSYSITAVSWYSDFAQFHQTSATTRMQVIERTIKETEERSIDDDAAHGPTTRPPFTKERQGKILFQSKKELNGVRHREQTRKRAEERWKTLFDNHSIFPDPNDPKTKQQLDGMSNLELMTHTTTNCIGGGSPFLIAIAFQSEIGSQGMQGGSFASEQQMRLYLAGYLQESSKLMEILAPTITNEKEAEAFIITAIGSFTFHLVPPLMHQWNLTCLPRECNLLLHALLNLDIHAVDFTPVLAFISAYGLDPTHTILVEERKESTNDSPSSSAVASSSSSATTTAEFVSSTSTAVQLGWEYRENWTAPVGAPVLPQFDPSVSLELSALQLARIHVQYDEGKDECYSDVTLQDPITSPDFDFSSLLLGDLSSTLNLCAHISYSTFLLDNVGASFVEMKRRKRFPQALIYAWRQYSRTVYEQLSAAEVMIPPLVDMTAEYLDLELGS